MYKKILHPTDFSPVSVQAFNQAVALAVRHGAELQIFHGVVLHEYDKSFVDKSLKKLNEAYDELRAELKPKMEEMLASSDIANYKYSVTIGRGFSAGDLIIDKAEESDADLIVMGTHGHSPFRHFFLGSVAEKVVRYAPCPVMVTGRQDNSPEEFKNILLPVDFSKASHKAADVATALAKSHSAELHVLHVYQDIVPPANYGYLVETLEKDSGFETHREEALKDFVANHKVDGVKITSHLIKGPTPCSIYDFSNQNSIDLVIMGTSGLTGIHHFLLGSVTDKVLRKSKVPVLTVRAQSNVTSEQE